jgi:hypothetical protein
VISEAVNDGKRAREVQEASDKAQKEKKQEAKA